MFCALPSPLGLYLRVSLNFIKFLYIFNMVRFYFFCIDEVFFRENSQDLMIMYLFVLPSLMVSAYVR